MSGVAPSEAAGASRQLMASGRLKVLLASGMDRFTIDAAFARALLAEREAAVNARADEFVAEAMAEAGTVLDAARRMRDSAERRLERARRELRVALWALAGSVVFLVAAYGCLVSAWWSS